MRILIVDDELVSRKKLEKIMENLTECEVVERGKDALKIAMSENPPDLILLDVMMPEMDGYEVFEKLKDDPQTHDIPVMFLSALDEKEDIIRGLEMGAVDYISKPFHRAEVKARVLTHLSLKEKTEQLRQKELQLIEMDRIAGIGTLAAGIAHEINNPLGFVKSSAGFLKKSLDKMIEATKYWDDKPVPEPLLEEYKDYLAGINFDHLANSIDSKYDRIKRGIERIMKIVNSLKSFSKIDMEAVGKLNINNSIEETIEIVSAQGEKELEFVKDLQEIPLIACFPNEINQCLLHTLKNGLDAIDQKGTIKIATSYDEKEDTVYVRIIDDGKGMSSEVLKQAKNPFFTTKPVGEGTGVGLSLTERIIKRHGGDIKIYSEENIGTTVIMAFPVVGETGSEQH